MFEEITLIQITVGTFGIFIIINGIIIILSLKYWNFFSKTYFIELISDFNKSRALQEIKNQYIEQRYFLSTILILLGIMAVAWSFGFDYLYLCFPFSIIGLILYQTFKK